MGYQEKHAKKTKSIHIKKSVSLLVALVLMIVVGTGTTLAYIVDMKGPISNLFLPAEVACAVVANEDDEISNIVIKNIGNTDAYIRAAVIVTWKDDTTNRNVYGKQPVENTDYTIKINTDDSSWELEDGFYYWTEPVGVNNFTDPLIESCTQKAEAPASGYSLSIEIVAEAIQADPFISAEAAWAVTE